MVHLPADSAPALQERFTRYLRDRGLPVTRQRLAIAETVFTSQAHLSVEEIQRTLRTQGERVGLATIYRTMDLLVRAAVVRQHEFGEGFRRFEPVTAQSAHEHLVCERCGQVLEFANDRLERMLRLIADEHDFAHRRHRVELYGVCGTCRGRELRPLGRAGAAS